MQRVDKLINNIIKMDFNYEGYRIVTAKEGKKVKAHCPVCADRRKDKRDKSLFIDTTSGAFRCFYCDWAGKALKPGEQKPVWE
jgi:twinkle protein